ncbi:MAG TPA: hypothetical protein VLV48_03125 [Thermoanaerobaculia bacterium]|nr:hypothetical protein [Thermoanaerobaculia bacterium]
MALSFDAVRIVAVLATCARIALVMEPAIRESKRRWRSERRAARVARMAEPGP